MNSQSKAKGSRAELAVRDILRKHTGLEWERTPLSGALDAVHGLSGDVYIPREKNKYTIEVKHYKDCHINHLLLSAENHQIFLWWKQAEREAIENRNKPLLIFKHDRSKLYVAKAEFSFKEDINKLIIERKDNYLEIALLEEWLETKPEFIL